ncbi:MAG: MBL fold metallo-hydrolase [Acidobacteria bacterium]|nr:MBL fold metallo-hydrolase [Acidobacteriota bacterium]
MILKQYYLNCLAHASYLVGGESSGVGLVVDPQRDVQQYLDDAKTLGLQIRYVALTHCHADFIAGHLELRKRAGAEICMGARAHAEFAFRPLRDGDSLELGSVSLQALETPGHTLESICLLVFDRLRDPARPYAVLTGDTLFIGDVGRPDLQAAVGVSAVELAGKLYDSLHEKILPLPDETLVYPAHGAGSLCGRKLSKETVSTLGEQRAVNYALQPMDRETFVRLMTADLPESPAYFSYDAALNSRERPTLDESLLEALQPLSLAEVLERQAAGAQVLDTREPADFARAHLAGSLHIGLGGQYATWAGTLLDKERPIILITEAGQEEPSAMRLGRIGFDRVTGYLGEGVEALEARRDLAEGWDRLSPAAVLDMLSDADPPVVIDVRSEKEHGEKSIEGSLNIPLSRLRQRLHEVPRERLKVVHCAGGYRSAIAAGILQGEGVPGVTEMAGGLGGWEAAGLPVRRAQA